MRRRSWTLSGGLLAVLALAGSTPGQEPRADLVLRGGPVFLADEAGTVAGAIAVVGDRVWAVGSEAEAEGWIGPRTRVIDLGGRLVTPGMNDAHMHLASGGRALLNVRLRGTTSLAEIEARVREATRALKPGEWIQGRGWDQTRLPPDELGPGGWPPIEPLDRAAPSHPVLLMRVDGHTAWANHAALTAAAIDRDTPDPPGGRFERDPRSGEPTGILRETAYGVVSAHIPTPSDRRELVAISKILDLARRSGVTSMQTSGSSQDLRLYARLRRTGRLTARLYVWRPLTAEVLAADLTAGITQAFGGPWLRTGLVKLYADGSVGSRSAWMLRPYSDDPSTNGIPRLPEEELRVWIRKADATHLQIAVHAIGDAANRAVLDAFAALPPPDPGFPRRHRIEHAQVLDPADIGRFSQLGVIASMQPTHATSDLRWAEDRIGHERARAGGYVWRSLLDSGARMAFGTDFAVEPLAPVEGLYSAVTRQSRERRGWPPGGWFPEQRLSIEEAIRLYTAGSAYAEFEENRKGTLEAGMLADLVVWNLDLLRIPAEQILDAEPDVTIVGGRIVYER